MNAKRLEKIRAGIVYTLRCEPEDIQVRGNAMMSGDDAEDRAAEQWIYDQLDAGNEWAWCYVVVEASHPDIPGLVGKDSLGCCSYNSREEFMQPGDYYDDMKAQSAEDLMSQLESIRKVVCGSSSLRSEGK